VHCTAARTCIPNCQRCAGTYYSGLTYHDDSSSDSSRDSSSDSSSNDSSDSTDSSNPVRIGCVKCDPGYHLSSPTLCQGCFIILHFFTLHFYSFLTFEKFYSCIFSPFDIFKKKTLFCIFSLVDIFCKKILLYILVQLILKKTLLCIFSPFRPNVFFLNTVLFTLVHLIFKKRHSAFLVNLI